MSWIEETARRFRLSDSSTATLEEIRRICDEEKALVVFAFRRPSHLKCAIIRSLCQIRGLPIPKGEISTGVQSAGYDQSSTFLFLRRRLASDSFRFFANRHRDHVERTLSALKRRHSSRPIIVVPCALFAGLGPRPWPPPFTLPIDSAFFPIYDLWESFRYAYLKKSLILEIGPLIELEQKISVRTELRQVAKELYRKEKTVRGARILKGSKVEQIVLSGESFDQALEQIAVHESLSRHEIMQRARDCFREIAGHISGAVVEFFRWILVPTVRRIFKHIDVRGIDHIRSACSQGPVVLISTHRSHFDYMLHGYVLYHNGLPLPYIAAGKNLDFFPAGPILRRSGAFFIRRKVDNDPLYKVVLERYLTYLIKQGHLIEFYIEGGRSRSGHTLQPRFGLLKSVIRTLSRGERRDILLVPAAISYERVPEDRALARERFGASKVKENVRSLFKARSIFKHRFGPVFVRFGEPISLRNALPLNGVTSPRQIESLGERISQTLNTLQALSDSSLLGAAILLSPGPRVKVSEIVENVDALLRGIAWGQGCLQCAATDFYRSRVWQNAVGEFFGIVLGSGAIKMIEKDLREDVIREQCESFATMHEIPFTDDAFFPTSENFVVLDFYRNALAPRIFAAAVESVLIEIPPSAAADLAKMQLSLHRWFTPILHLPTPTGASPTERIEAGLGQFRSLFTGTEHSKILARTFSAHATALTNGLNIIDQLLESTRAETALAFRKEVSQAVLKAIRTAATACDQEGLLTLRADAQTDTMAEFVNFVFNGDIFSALKRLPSNPANLWKERLRESVQELRGTVSRLHLAIQVSTSGNDESFTDYTIHTDN